MPGPPAVATGADAELAELRRRLLLGRGVGASSKEVQRRTRDRADLGGELTVLALQRVQQQAQLARGERPTPPTIAPLRLGQTPPDHRALASVLGVVALVSALRTALRRARPGGRAVRRDDREDARA